MADQMLNWNGATIELPKEPAAAASCLEELLAQPQELMSAQRRLNIANTLEHHDWRHRVAQLCQVMDWPMPESLRSDLQRVADLAGTWRRASLPVRTAA
jgi:hypothetical protein